MTNKEEQDKLAQIERQNGLRTLLSTPQSRQVMWDLFGLSAIYHVAQSLDIGRLAFTEGKRSHALETMNQFIAVCPDLYDRMFAENRSRIALEQQEAKDRENE